MFQVLVIHMNLEAVCYVNFPISWNTILHSTYCLPDFDGICYDAAFLISSHFDIFSLSFNKFGKSLYILFILSKNYLFNSLNLCFLVSISLIESMIFLIALLSFGLGWITVVFEYLEFLLCYLFEIAAFLVWALIAIILFLRTAFAESHRFWYVILTLSFASRIV